MRLSLAFCYRLHRRLGLLLIVPLLAIAGSGLVLIFFDQLRYSAEPYALDEPVQTALPPIELIETIQRTKPDRRLLRLYLPHSNSQTARAVFDGKDGKSLAFFDPATGLLISLRDANQKDWLDWLYRFHQGKTFGMIGQLLFSLSGLMVSILWLLGVFLFTSIPINKRSMFYHRHVGLTFGGLLAAFMLCGAVLNFVVPLQQSLKPLPFVPESKQVASTLALSELLTIAGNIYPHSALERFYIDKPVNNLMMVRFRDGARFYFNKQDGQCVGQQMPLSHWLDWLYPLHSGRLFGGVRYPLLILLGITLLILAWGGGKSAVAKKRR